MGAGGRSDAGVPGRELMDVGAQAERTSLHPGDAVGLDILPSSYHLFDRNGRTIAAAH